MHLPSLFVFFCFFLGTFAFECYREVPITGVERIGLGVLVNPETIVEDSLGFIYTGTSDGSIRRVNPTTLEITTYAYTVPTLTNRTGCGQPLNEPLCGRALGLAFDSNDNLYVADAYKGLLLIPRNNVSNVQVLSSQSDGIPFHFTNALVFNKEENVIYFTDSSSLPRYLFVRIVLENKAEGRLLKYDVATGVTTTLVSGLHFANGVAFDKLYRYVAVNELGTRKVVRYWVKGFKAGQTDVLTNDVGGYNDNIELDESSGDFLVGLFAATSDIVTFTQEHQNLAGVLNTYAPPAVVLGLIPPQGLIKVVNTVSGRVEKALVDKNGTSLAYVAEARHIGNYIYIGSVINPFLGRIPASLLNQQGTLVCDW